MTGETAATASLLCAGLQALPAPGRDVGEMLALVLFLAFPAASALAVGGSLIGRDLAERRLSFYFSRPLAAGSLWAGKFLGGAALVVASFVCCILPLARSLAPAPGALVAWALALLGLMGLAHVASTMYRSGSRLLVLAMLARPEVPTTWTSIGTRELSAASWARVLFRDWPRRSHWWSRGIASCHVFSRTSWPSFSRRRLPR